MKVTVKTLCCFVMTLLCGIGSLSAAQQWTVTTRKIERKQESGGSSVHTGSSGKSHGGRSGKF